MWALLSRYLRHTELDKNENRTIRHGVRIVLVVRPLSAAVCSPFGVFVGDKNCPISFLPPLPLTEYLFKRAIGIVLISQIRPFFHPVFCSLQGGDIYNLRKDSCFPTEMKLGISIKNAHAYYSCMYRPSRLQAAGLRLRRILRSTTPLLACEVVAVRLSLGNLAATCEENIGTSPAQRGAAGHRGVPQTAISRDGASEILQPPSSPRETSKNDTTDVQFLRGSSAEKQTIDGAAVALPSGEKALRHFLHAIHACPTASAAWLNASEVQ